MAKKQMNGQMDLFEYINSIQMVEPFGDMKMGSLMPEDSSFDEPVIDFEEEKTNEQFVEEQFAEDQFAEDQFTEEQFDEKQFEKEQSLEEEPMIVLEESLPENVDNYEDNVNSDEKEVSEPEVKDYNIEDAPVMSKYFKDSTGKDAFVEYRNYNRVLIQYPNEQLIEKQFASSNEAVDAYIDAMIQMSESYAK